MARPKPIIHGQLEYTDGHIIQPGENIELSEEQINWLADFFTPIIKESLAKKRVRETA